MIRITEIRSQRGFSPSGLYESDYVINPYRGCAFGCRYCYVQKNKTAKRAAEPWGEFVDVKTNLPELVKEEIKSRHLKRVLIGSVTDPYQPVELHYGLTRKTLELLAENQVRVTILTRSSHILRDAALLAAMPDTIIYFTINWPQEGDLRVFEKRSPTFAERMDTIRQLTRHKLNVIPNVSPLVPGLFDPAYYFKHLAPVVNTVSFESLNLKVLTFDEICAIFTRHFPAQYLLFKKVYAQEAAFKAYWDGIRHEIELENKKYKLTIEYRFHSFDSYFGRD